MPQTSYDLNMAAAFAGMKADARYDEIISFQAEGAVAFGRGVVAGTNAATQVKQPTAGGTFKGIAVHTHKTPSSAGVARYEDTEMVNVMRKGQVWVEVTGVIAIGNSVRVVDNGGQFTAGTSGSSAVTGCQFMSAYATGVTPAIALVDINLPS